MQSPVVLTGAAAGVEVEAADAVSVFEAYLDDFVFGPALSGFVATGATAPATYHSLTPSWPRQAPFFVSPD